MADNVTLNHSSDAGSYGTIGLNGLTGGMVSGSGTINLYATPPPPPMVNYVPIGIGTPEPNIQIGVKVGCQFISPIPTVAQVKKLIGIIKELAKINQNLLIGYKGNTVYITTLEELLKELQKQETDEKGKK